MSGIASIPTAQGLPIHSGTLNMDVLNPENLQPVDPLFGIKVVLRSLDNQMYVTQAGGAFSYTAQKDQALVFDLVEDNVFQSIHQVRKELGHIWVALPLEADSAFERCDGCNKLFEVAEVMMRHHRFYCGECLEHAPGNTAGSLRVRKRSLCF